MFKSKDVIKSITVPRVFGKDCLIAEIFGRSLIN